MGKYKKFFAIAVCSLLLFTVYFYRDPDRDITKGNNIILSPADGTVEYIKFYKNGEAEVFKDGNYYVLNVSKYFPNGCYVIGIFMSPLDVHVNRAPISGKVVYTKHIDGSFYPAFLKDVEKINERNVVIIKNGSDYIGVAQIAGFVARRCVLNIKEGDYVEMGERIGKIKLGSQTAVIIPSNYNITIKVGEKVYAGQTIVAVKNTAN
ncbi:phosphatidylserine decarboxylase related protein [Methanocaldococcus bathoardescens]|uniref:Phosphatidylserine decarboxylase related protein n=1 Tax=Methanocaldococcus bathoardescens TaxID=1301915 RepID=A0A076LHI6_9EURY|nr:archaetidylserine decarboxylase [Methanocaldococcus bathoardescens]AIJ05928.1 phosphatidylserine decarboxylase related protein [Methanocaldococcus bathoardescens]